ncbi:glycosyltransferase family 2 protein [Nonomuraea soli]|nr:glycosyltransferase family 2 protein [Nonomuraea soli]
MPMKVSVIVPVYNPGPYIEDCVASMLRQSLPAEEFEVIFVDDGSTDETPARLDVLAAEHDHIRVIHQENSGWSGKPRNVGIEEARGEFVMFVDNDDWLGDEALERMYQYGVANEADVIIGKMAGKGRSVPLELFRVNRPQANLANAPLMDSLTPHKMFRKEFLNKHGVRFPEGRRRLEDHVFVTEAYLLARNVAVLSDYLCYHHIKREDATNAGFQPFDPVGYFANLSEALDIVERHTQPGPMRDRIFRRWLRNEMVERLRGKRLLAMPADFREKMFTEIHKVASARFGPGVAAGMEPIQQLVAGLVVAGQYEEVLKLAEWEAGIRLSTSLESLDWRAGALHLTFSSEFTANEQPLAFTDDGDQIVLRPPLGSGGGEAVALLDANASVKTDRARMDLVVRARKTAGEFYQPVSFEPEHVPMAEPGLVRFVLRGAAAIDPQTAGAGAPLEPGIWDVIVRQSGCGWTKETRLGSIRSESVTKGRTGALVGDPGRLVLPYWTDPHGNLSLDVGQVTQRVDYDLQEGIGAEHGRIRDGRLEITLPLHPYAPATPVAVRFVSRTAGRIDATGTLDSVLRVEIPDACFDAGRWRVSIALPKEGSSAGRFVVLPIVLVCPEGEGEPFVQAVTQALEELQPAKPKARSGFMSLLRRR